MHHLISFFTHISPTAQLILYGGVLFICWNIENIAGLAFNYKKWKHAFLNAGFIITNIPVQYLMGLAFAIAIKWTGANHFGLLYHLPAGHHPLIIFGMTFIFLDFGEYMYHVLMHKIKRLWMFHVVHHSDRIVDVSTTLREHPCEGFIRLSFTLLWVFLSGALFWAVLIRQTIQIFTTLFAHMNYRLPDKLDRAASLLFITPNLHHVHHHYKQPFTDCNYGDVLSIWDRLFGTFCRLPSDEVVFGLDTFMEEKENSRFISLIKMPFGKYRKNKGTNPEPIS